MPWSKVHFYFAHQATSYSVTSTEAGEFAAANLLDGLDTTLMKAAGTGDQYWTMQNPGSAINVDYVAIAGHNWNTVGATYTLQYSSDNFGADINDAFSGFIPSNDLVFVKEFTLLSQQYWRHKLSGMSDKPQAAIAIFGERTELDFVDVDFDPDGEKHYNNISITQAGRVSGIHEKYKNRVMNLGWNEMDESQVLQLRTWQNSVGNGHFFVAWEKTEHPTQVYLMRHNGDFVFPKIRGGIARNVQLNLVGRKE